jgi:tetratricopeptide (TPR) repeat protein
MGVNAIKTLNPLGEVARLQKKYDQAVSYYQECLTIAQRIPGLEEFSTPLANLGHVAIRQGELQQATDYFRESTDQDKNGFDVVWNLWGFGLVAAAGGRMRQATRLYAVVDKLLQSDGPLIVYREDQADYTRDIALVCEQLGEADFAAAWAEGQRMSPEEAVAYALEELKEIP